MNEMIAVPVAAAISTAAPAIAAGGGLRTAEGVPLNTSDVDPIFAAIDAHREANEQFSRAVDAFGAAETAESHEKRFPAQPRIQIGQKPKFNVVKTDLEDGGFALTSTPSGKTSALYATSDEDIEQNVPAELDAIEREKWIVARKEELAKERQRCSAKWARSRLGRLDSARDKASALERERMWDLIWTIPTTAKGLAALLAYCREQESINELVGEEEWEDVLEWTIECSVCALAGLPEPPMSDLVASVYDEFDEEAAA